MPVSNHYRRVPCKDITIKRTERQRVAIDTGDIIESIRKRGVLVPILIERDLTLIAGERRLTASLQLGYPDIPCRFMDELDLIEAQIVEFEENARRSDLTWQETTSAIGLIHGLFLTRDPLWTASSTAKELHYHPGHISKHLRIYRDLSNPKIAEMPTYAAAINFLMRQDERSTENSVSMILEAGRKLDTDKKLDPFTVLMDIVFDVKRPEAAEASEASEAPTKTELLFSPIIPSAEMPGLALHTVKSTAFLPLSPLSDTILHQDFLQWAPAYQGRKFNFIHCDFPYGVNLWAGKQSGFQHAEEIYDDGKDTFWTLLEALLLHRDNLMQNTCHIMFWFSMDYYSQIFEFFRKKAPEFTINPFPLIWHKSDGSAILPDSRRAGRRSYETALLITRGDRSVVRAIANLYAAPTDKKHHPSTKPEPMLRHFFQLFVDQHTYMLDPTCGGGSSIRAAESMGAELLVGLEKDPGFHEKATNALRQFRLLSQATKL